MHIFILEADMDRAGLLSALLREPAEAGTAFDRIRALNPQVADFQRLAAGTVLILPDSPQIKDDAGTTLGADNLGDLAEDLRSGLESLSVRLKASANDLKSDRADVAAARKSLNRLVGSDPLLAERRDSSEAESKLEQKRLAETEAQLAEMQKIAPGEYDQLRKLFRS